MNCKSSVKSGTAVGISVGIAVGVAVATLTHVSHNLISTAAREAVAATTMYLVRGTVRPGKFYHVFSNSRWNSFRVTDVPSDPNQNTVGKLSSRRRFRSEHFCIKTFF